MNNHRCLCLVPILNSEIGHFLSLSRVSRAFHLCLDHPDLLLVSDFWSVLFREGKPTHLHVSASDSRRLESKQLANEHANPQCGSASREQPQNDLNLFLQGFVLFLA